MRRATTTPIICAGLFALLLAGAGGCGLAAAPTVWIPGNRQPMIVGWQQFFRIQWDATKRTDHTIVEGFITNTWGFTAQQVQLLVTGFDASGQSLGQVVAWGPNEIDPGARVFFNVPVPPGATTYEVAIFAWNWVQAGGVFNSP
jgi:hypothetical protein